MEEFRKTITVLAITSVVLLLMMILGLFAINKFFDDGQESIEVNSNQILRQINDQYFVVTKTVYLDEEANIEISTGSRWSDILWGQNLQAEATIRVDVGVDMKGITADDIVVDSEKKTVTIKVPEAQVLDASVNGDIDLKSSSGFLKKLFASDSNEDYNLALEKLMSQAESGVESDKDLMNDARDSSMKLLELIVERDGYMFVDGGK